jgi:hypothetical protein
VPLGWGVGQRPMTLIVLLSEGFTKLTKLSSLELGDLILSPAF